MRIDRSPQHSNRNKASAGFICFLTNLLISFLDGCNAMMERMDRVLVLLLLLLLLFAVLDCCCCCCSCLLLMLSAAVVVEQLLFYDFSFGMASVLCHTL